VTTDTGTDQASSGLSYEAAFANLEDVLQKLERDDLPLEESLVLYEQGVALAAHCATLLDSAELRVQQWQVNGTTTDFTGWQEG
jgi:exodeoxyribonuclease VII small subunit